MIGNGTPTENKHGTDVRLALVYKYAPADSLTKYKVKKYCNIKRFINRPLK